MPHSHRLADLFEGVAGKYLSAVDVDPETSNQHEIGGLVSVGFADYLGRPGKGEERRLQALMVYITDEDTEPMFAECKVTWYDSRRNNPDRSPEYRLYYRDNAVTECLGAGDFMLIAKRIDERLLIVFAPRGTEVEYQLRTLFGLNQLGNSFQRGLFDDAPFALPIRLLLEDLGVEADIAEADDDELLHLLQARFSGLFPTTREFSAFARDRVECDPLADPDGALMSWMEMEERLFRLFERGIVAKRLRDGFGQYGDDVDEFISFSLSVQNRRKARVGRALENHLRHLFQLQGLQFEEGGHSLVTESKSKPDFLFPDFGSYHNPAFPVARLRILGAKTTCKDRWRQVLAEADRIADKHLITLEPGISEQQTNEMRERSLRLVVPSSLQKSYSSRQREWLWSVADFIRDAKATQADS